MDLAVAVWARSEAAFWTSPTRSSAARIVPFMRGAIVYFNRSVFRRQIEFVLKTGPRPCGSGTNNPEGTLPLPYGHGTVRQLFEFFELFFDFGGFLLIGGELDVLLIRRLCLVGVLEVLLDFAQAQPGIGVAVIPFGGRGVAQLGSAELVILEILIADGDVLLGLQGVEGVFLVGERLVLFRRDLFLRAGGRLGTLGFELLLLPLLL